MIRNQKETNKKIVIEKYADLKKLQTDNIKNRSWLLDVLACVNSISDIDFTLHEMYQFTEKLRQSVRALL